MTSEDRAGTDVSTYDTCLNRGTNKLYYYIISVKHYLPGNIRKLFLALIMDGQHLERCLGIY